MNRSLYIASYFTIAAAGVLASAGDATGSAWVLCVTAVAWACNS